MISKTRETPSKYQEAIFNHIENTDRSLIVRATAGSGKSWTLRRGLDYTTGKVGITAFNRPIAQEMKKMVPPHVEVGTLHSFGLKIIRKNMRNVEVYDKKTSDICKDVCRDAMGSYDRGQVYTVERIAQMAKSALLTAPDIDDETIEEIVERYGFDLKNTPVSMMTSFVRSVLHRCLELQNCIDYDDMIWLPAIMLHRGEWEGLRFPTLFVDEAQDLNSSQMELVANMIGPKGRIIAVGDDRQAIYGWRGANSDALNQLKARFDAVELPLSICYRCPSTHLDLARTIVPTIEPSPTAIPGTIETVSREKLASIVRSSDLVLCRTNGPLVSLAFELIRQGVKATVRGRDIGKGLEALINKSRKTTTIELSTWLSEYRAREVLRLRESEQEQQAISLEDKVDCLFALMDTAHSTVELKAKIETLFSDNVQGVVLSSIHRAKGLESDRIFVLDWDRMPMVWKRQTPEQLEQETNLQFIALTRSRSELYFIDAKIPAATPLVAATTEEAK